ncbi:hypothetical protein ACEPAI_407 [Sanghuangporus weigelae]
MSVPLKVPVGDTPDWETKEYNDEGALNNVFESSALYYSLRQSRNAWLSNVFPKFTSKSKAKGQKGVVQPPHNLRFISKCDLEIGPHVFADTSVYEAHYLSEPPQFATSISPTYAPTTTYSQTTSGTFTYPLTSYNPYVAPAAPMTPLVPPGAEMKDPDVTPALIARVNEAAATNPTLHNLLQIAAAGDASIDQLRTLGFFIQQLAAVQQQQAQSTSSSTTNFLGAQRTTPQSAFMQAANYSPSHVISKKHDLILEFRENHIERFLVPREIVACEQEIQPSQTFRKDIVLYTFVPFLNNEIKFKSGSSTSSRTPTVIRFLNVSDAIWETIRGWVNEEAKRTDAWDSFYDKTEASGPRAYLQLRLPDGDLLSQLKMSCEDEFPMKPIRPSVSSETTSRRNRTRKPATQVSSEVRARTDVPIADVQAAPSLGTEESSSVKGTGPMRRKSNPKIGARSASGTADGLFFINTIVPKPQPLQSHPEASSTAAPTTAPATDEPTQPSEGTA